MHQRFHRWSRGAPLVSLTALLLLGCGDDAPGGGNNTNENGNYNQNCPPQMAIQGAAQLNLMVDAQADLTVQVTDCNADPITGAVVAFEIGGDDGGASLSVLSAVTGSDGLASVTLTAGSENATFDVTATTAGADSVTWAVTVTSDPIGLIVVNMTYNGDKVFDTYESYLFQNSACGGLDPFDIQGAVMGAAPVNVISAHPQFPGVPEGTNYSVGVVASFNGETLGWGCVDALTVTPGQVTDADVTIDDIPVNFNGLYYLDNHFDLTGALPPSVATVLAILDEMTDDHELDGDAATNQWGLDPSAFLLDFVFRQFCCWSAEDTDPNTQGIQADWSSCSAQSYKHDYGDLQVLYQQNFQNWEGAQPVAWGMCGVLDQSYQGMDAHKYAQDYVQGYIDDYVPDFILNLLQIIGDLSRVFTQMNILSELTVDDIDISKEGNFTHELKTLVIELHDLDGQLQTYQVDLAAAQAVPVQSYAGSTTATDTTLTIPPHEFQLKFGKLLQYVYLNYLLPLFGVTNTGDLLALWIDCTNDVGPWLFDVVDNLLGSVNPISEQDMINYCDQGLQAAGNYVDTSIDDWIDVTATFELQGTCEAGDLDENRTAITLVNGQWDGTITEGGFNASFTGTFTGDKNAP